MNSNESPGKKGITTSPVSTNTTRKSSAYTHGPYACTKVRMCLSICRIKSIRKLMISMEMSPEGQMQDSLALSTARMKTLQK